MDFTSSTGKRYTKGLFVEFGGDKYTLSENDLEDGTPSLRRLYVECSDVTEHIFATKYLGGWDHWKLLCQSPLLQPHIQAWREELQVKLRSDAIQRILDEAQDPANKGYMQANRYLADKTYLQADEPKKGRGRPRKGEENLTDMELERLTKDAERILKGKNLQ